MNEIKYINFTSIFTIAEAPRVVEDKITVEKMKKEFLQEDVKYNAEYDYETKTYRVVAWVSDANKDELRNYCTFVLPERIAWQWFQEKDQLTCEIA